VEAIVRKIRAGEISVNPGSPAAVIAHHRDTNGQLLDPHTAAVEIINLIRPTVAIAFYIAWIALAMHDHPEELQKLRDDPDPAQYFVQEVRRFYPFTPFLGARVRTGFEWKGHRFEPDTLVLLDVYGTDRDPAVWKDPDSFRPGRFKTWEGSAYDFIPQGGGEYRSNPRCAGEAITVGIMEAATRLLASEMDYDMPEQDLQFRLARMPAKPNSGVVINKVRSRTEAEVHVIGAERFLDRKGRGGDRPQPMR
jgi:fatty-acid peroxygenase